METDRPTQLLLMPFVNPQNGPIMVDGAEKGDALAVHIESMVPRGENPRGTCCMIPEFGALTGTYHTATLNDALPELVRKSDLDEEWVYWSDRVMLPYRPHIGILSCSPEIDSINSLTLHNHGGNMDAPDMGPGSITYLPVCTKGARLFIGDAHACQGDEEVWRRGRISVTTIRVDLSSKRGPSSGPGSSARTFFTTLSSARPLEDAARSAYRELVRCIRGDPKGASCQAHVNGDLGPAMRTSQYEGGRYEQEAS